MDDFIKMPLISKIPLLFIILLSAAFFAEASPEQHETP